MMLLLQPLGDCAAGVPQFALLLPGQPGHAAAHQDLTAGQLQALGDQSMNEPLAQARIKEGRPNMVHQMLSVSLKT